MVTTVTKTIGTGGVFSTLALWESGAPASLTTAEKSAAGTFAVASFTQGETLTFVGSGATGVFLDTDSTGVGTGTYVTYGITTGNPAASDVVTGGSSAATCVLSSSTPMDTGIIWQGQQLNEELSGTGTRLNISGSTASSTAYKHITTASGASFNDNANKLTNALRYNSANGAAIKGTSANTQTVVIGETGARVTDLQIAATGSGGFALSFAAGSAPFLVDQCILEGTYAATADNRGVFYSVSQSPTVSNTAIIQKASAADHIIGTGTGSPKFYNCTIAAADDLATAPTSVFLSGASGTVTVQNCGMFAGDSTKAIKAGSATFNFTTCYSDISGTSGVTQATYSSEFENINDATLDLRLKTGAAQIDTGTTDATNAPVDIVGTARAQGSAYDVGAWELIAASGIAIPVILRQFSARWD